MPRSDRTMAPSTVADELQKEIIRVRDKVMPEYILSGRPGVMALSLMRVSLDRAMKALAEQDAVACINSLHDLRDWEV